MESSNGFDNTVIVSDYIKIKYDANNKKIEIPLSNTYVKFSNSDYINNNNLTSYSDLSLDQCLKKCDLEDNCNGLTYDNSNNCILKNNIVYKNKDSVKELTNTDLYFKQPGDDLQKLIFDNPIYKSTYLVGSLENKVGFNDDLATAKEIVNSINLNLSQLNYVQNQINLKNNVNQEILLKQEELLKLENDELMNQLKNLENMESIISNKNKMIEQTGKNIEQTNFDIKFITISILIAILILIVIILYGSKVITSTTLTSIITVTIIIYLCFLFYFYNIFNIKDIVSFMIDRKNFELKHKGVYLPNIDDIIKKDNTMSEDESTWISNHCSCPKNNIIQEEDENNYDKLNSNYDFNKLSPGYFYYDDSAPPQLLVPNPENSEKNQINWVDYSDNGVVRFNNIKQEDNNNKYYNYGNKVDPRNKLINKLNKSNSLVNDITYTKNM
jgi:hypothetical protein